MGLRYANSAPIPIPESPLSGLLPGYEYGRQKRLDEDAADAFAEIIGGREAPQQPSGMSLDALNPGSYASTMPAQRVGGDVVQQSQQSAASAVNPTTQSGLDAYIANARQAESGGNPNARNPNSSATGLYQFTEGTWNGLMRNQPELGLTADGRTNPAQQERAMRAFTQGNARSLSSAGLPVNPGNLYAAHFLGAQGATDVLGLPDQTPMVAAVSPEVVRANPFLADMTVGDFKQWSAGHGGGSNGGYQAPREPQMAQTSAPQMPGRDAMRALFANPETRDFAIQLAQQAQSGGVQQFQTVPQPDGSIWQIDMSTGEASVLQDAPDAPEPGGASFDAERNLRTEYQNQQGYKDFIAQEQAYQRVLDSAQNASPAGDLALIFNYMKILDPGSVVRESEFATAAASGSFGDRIQAAAQQVQSGQRLSPAMRRDFVQRAGDLFTGASTLFGGMNERYGGLANQYGLDPSRIIRNPAAVGVAGDNWDIDQFLGPPTQQSAEPEVLGPPEAGQIINGWRYIGGDPAAQTSYEFVEGA